MRLSGQRELLEKIERSLNEATARADNTARIIHNYFSGIGKEIADPDYDDHQGISPEIYAKFTELEHTLLKVRNECNAFVGESADDWQKILRILNQQL